MTVTQSPCPLVEEFAELLAGGATAEQIVGFRPSEPTAQRASGLLQKEHGEGLTREERHEFDMFTQAELLLRLVKARLRNGDLS